MKISSLFLVLIASTASFNSYANRVAPWNKSPQLEELIVNLKKQYSMENQSELRKQNLSEVDNLSYFIRFIDKDGSPEQAKLKAFLLGTQIAYSRGVYQQMQTNVIPWFCPKGGYLETRTYSGNPTLFIENLIYEAMEKDIKLDPTSFTRSNGIGAFSPTNSFIMYGLQTKYPCYDTVPEAHRLNGFFY
ncbi:hypothetical protein NB537_00095 [Vibrio parahaemolyticus]|nr:hypothetical protein [Vibrio parahaemolyticus]MCR9653199.1 hypothetical protein [Vibrio parahaemolyticus]MDF5595814.1 hypothetical protein [Vibrio parahaemolyticus]